MYVGLGVCSGMAAVSMSSAIVLSYALKLSRQSERRAWNVLSLLMVECGHLTQSCVQAQATAIDTTLQLEQLQGENQQLNKDIGAARTVAAEVRETVRILTTKLNTSLFELDQLTATYAFMKEDLKREAVAAASETVARAYWEVEAKRLRGSVAELNSEIAEERAAEVRTGIAEAVVTHIISIATGG